MRITIDLETDNAAFETCHRNSEIVRILQATWRQFYRYGAEPTKLRDINGNTVGWITVEDNA